MLWLENRTDLNKSEQLFKELYDSILDGKLAVGTRLATEMELAGTYNCSRVTVRSSLKRLEELKLIRRYRGKGTYVCNRRVRNQERPAIGIVFTDFGPPGASDVDPYSNIIIMTLLRQRDFHDFTVNFIPIHDQEHFMDGMNRQGIDANQFDGLIFTKQLSAAEVDQLEEEGRDFIALVEAADEREISCVLIDNFNGAYMAASHLIRQGFRKIVLLHGPLHDKINREKLSGFFHALNENGILDPADRRHLEILPHEDTLAAEVTRGLLREKRPFDALIVQGDWGTVGAVSVLREAGLRIPEDVGILMYDDLPTAQKVLKMELSAIRQPHNEQIRIALENLLRRIGKPTPARIVQIIQPILMIRGTT